MSEIVKGLFGFTPEELTMRRDTQDQAEALAYARLSPTELANYGIARGAGQLARGVVGMLGATDPEMKKASDLDSILKTSDPTSVAGLRAMAKKAADMGYGNEAMQASAAADKMEQDQADLGFKRSQTTKNLQVPDTATPEMKNATAVANSVATPGTPEWNKAYTAKLEELASKEGTVQKVGVAKGTEQAVYRDKNGQFIYGKDAEGKQVRVPYSGGVDQTTSKSTTTNVLKQPSNIVEFRKTINEIIKKPKEAMDAADSAIELADDALKTNNFAAVAGLSSKLAKSMGDNDISNRDVARFGGDASLVGSVSDTLATLATGTPTKDTIRKLRAVARIVSLKNKELIASEETAQRGLAKASGDYTDAQLDELFKLRPTAKGVTSGQTKSGTKYTVEGQ
jgi:hypothetical protein